MKISGNKGIANILKILLEIGMVIGVIFLIMLYWITKWLNLNFDWFIMMIYPCGIGFLLLIYQLIGLLNALKMNTPFCYDNVQKMKKGMLLSYFISVFILLALLATVFFYDYYSLQLQVALVVMIVLFIAIGIALYILSELFREATDYKEENDLTI